MHQNGHTQQGNTVKELHKMAVITTKIKGRRRKVPTDFTDKQATPIIDNNQHNPQQAQN